MNSKGFTLIELLVTIGLLAMASTIIAVNMTGIQSNTNETEIKRFHTKIATSGCMYVDKGQVLKSLDNTTKDLKLGNNTSNCESSYKTRDACKNNSIHNGDGCYVCLSTIVNEGLIEDTLYDPETDYILTKEIYIDEVQSGQYYFDNGVIKDGRKIVSVFNGEEENIKVHIKWIDEDENGNKDGYYEKKCYFCRNNCCTDNPKFPNC